jgi:hypothetical protein
MPYCPRHTFAISVALPLHTPLCGGDRRSSTLAANETVSLVIMGQSSSSQKFTEQDKYVSGSWDRLGESQLYIVRI